MKKKKVLIAPSILSADFSRLAEEIKTVEKCGADLIHVDVMDGHFVPNITIGPAVVASLKKSTRLKLDVHLMIKNPLFFLDAFIKAGSSIITVHSEVCSLAVIRKIKKKFKNSGVKLGISLNPRTPAKLLNKQISFADLILVMSVNPGFGGQKFMPAALKKISQIRKIFPGDIEVDGGITDLTAPGAVKAGANILVAGSYIFKAKNRAQAIKRLKNA